MVMVGEETEMHFLEEDYNVLRVETGFPGVESARSGRRQGAATLPVTLLSS